MGLKAAGDSDYLIQTASLSHSSKDAEMKKKMASCGVPKFMVIGHRGHGMNNMLSSDARLKCFKENTLLSFNAASKHKIQFIELDVQVTSDGCPVIFNYVYSRNDKSNLYEKSVDELTLSQFLAYGPQRDKSLTGKPLWKRNPLELPEELATTFYYRKWDVEFDDSFCTLQEAFQNVDSRLGFLIDLRFKVRAYRVHDLIPVIRAVLQVVDGYAKTRPIFFCSSHPDAALLVRGLQSNYPVFFLKELRRHMHFDVRRNTLEDALKVCLEGELQGIIANVEAVFEDPDTAAKIKKSNLSLITHGILNRELDAVSKQRKMGKIDGVIVDFVREISEFVDNASKEEED